jgi:FMN phosphatase YigB (HAD superfamily)
MKLTLLIDLDDTLLPHSTEKFIPPYLKALSGHLSELASPQRVQEVLLSATRKAMENHDPATTIKQAFDDYFYPTLGTTYHEMEDSLLDFYNTKYPGLSPISSPYPDIVKFMDESLERGYQLVIATNPIFPKIATAQRLQWAGFPTDEYPYALISTYEDFHFSKPHPAYFMEILAQIGWPESQVVMIGNDFNLDILPAKQIGLPTFWITDDYTKKSCKPRHGAGSLKDFHSWLELQNEESITPDLSSFNTSLETLRTTPAALLTLLDKSPAGRWNLRPDQISWSITEVLCHLRDVDQEIHLPRFEILRDNPAPFLTGIDADTWADEREYVKQDGQQALSDFINSRKQLVDLVSKLPKSVEQKEIRHTIFGPTTLTEIISIAARHDRLHIQQLFSLIHSV